MEPTLVTRLAGRVDDQIGQNTGGVSSAAKWHPTGGPPLSYIHLKAYDKIT